LNNQNIQNVVIVLSKCCSRKGIIYIFVLVLFMNSKQHGASYLTKTGCQFFKKYVLQV
jgi:hypothetical protein